MISPAKKPLSIILAEDDYEDRQFFTEVLKEIKVDAILTVYHDGKELLEGLKKTGQVPDFVFIDLNMPKLSGLDSLKDIREIESFRGIPVVAILASSDDENDKNDTFGAGANAYITKPSKYHILRDMISKVLQIDWTATTHRKNFVIKIN